MISIYIFKCRFGNMVLRLCTLLYSVPIFYWFNSKFFTLLQLRVKHFFMGDRGHEAIETLPHILIECEPVKKNWKVLKYWLSLKSGIFLQPTVSEIITGFQNPDLVMFNAVYLLTKCYLCRCSTSMDFPSMRVFKTLLRRILL